VSYANSSNLIFCSSLSVTSLSILSFSFSYWVSNKAFWASKPACVLPSWSILFCSCLLYKDCLWSAKAKFLSISFCAATSFSFSCFAIDALSWLLRVFLVDCILVSTLKAAVFASTTLASASANACLSSKVDLLLASASLAISNSFLSYFYI